ncbi:hypothetical protein BMF94_6692, partial [Rhodotorula taiwanensis]
MFHSNGWKAVGSGGGSYTNGDVRSRMLAAVRPFISTKRNLALTVVVATFALFALLSHSASAASTLSSSSSTSSSHYRLPASRFNPSSWRSPFSFSFSGHAATCTPHAPADLRDRFERASRPLDPDASTQQRLDDWEFEAPGWGVEPADWVRRNVESCPSHRIKPNQNSQLLDNAHLVWTALNTTGIMALRSEMIGFLRKKEAEGKMGPDAWGQGK